MNILFIDTSYFIFYRYYAILNWLKMSDKIKDTNNINPENIILDNDFLEKFEKKCHDTVKQLEKKFNPDKVFFCKDCPRKNIWRLKLLPSYKGNRDSFNGRNVFNIFYENILPSIINSNKDKYFVNKCDECEADDIVAVGVSYYKKINPSNNIYIITSDHDYLQLLRYNNLDIYDLKFKNLKLKSIGENDLIYKILMGDKSDNISGVKNRLGKKTIAKLIENNKLEEFINSDPVIKSNYELNNNLINFEKIPENLKTNILSIFMNI